MIRKGKIATLAIPVALAALALPACQNAKHKPAPRQEEAPLVPPDPATMTPVGESSSVEIMRRIFEFQQLGEGGKILPQKGYGLRITVDDLSMEFTCTVTGEIPGNFSLRGTRVYICGGLANVVFTPDPGSYVVNGKMVKLEPKHTYFFDYEGKYTIVK